MKNKIRKLRVTLLIVFIIVGMDFAQILYANPVVTNGDKPQVPISSLSNSAKAYNVAIGASDQEILDDTYNKLEKKFFIEASKQRTRDFEYSRISDAGNNLKEFDPQTEKVVEITKIKEIIAERPNSIQTEEILNETDFVIIPGLLVNTTHQMEPTSSGEIFMDSTLERYQLDANTLINKLVDQNQQVKNGGMFNLVVFVSDYKNKGIDKLLENKVWRQVYSRLDSWMKETSDYYVMLVNEYGSPQHIMNILAEAELNSNINKIGVTFVAHGVNSIFGHGILLHHDNDPKRLGVMDGYLLGKALSKTGVPTISKLVFTNVHSCYLIDEYEYYGKNSVLGFFEQQNSAQVLTGYRGLTYLNTKFVLSLENLLAAGTYEFPVTTITTPVTLIDDEEKILGDINLVEKNWYEIKSVSESSSERFKDEYSGDETLFVNDINNSPADNEAIYYDASVYEHLGTVPPSFFPTIGDEYSFEGHRSGTWQVIDAINDDNTFFFASDKYGGYLEEFGDGFETNNVLSSHWNQTSGTSSLDNGYLELYSGTIEEVDNTNRPLNVESDVIFKHQERSSTSSFEISLIGDVSSYSVTSTGYDNSSRKFGIRFEYATSTTDDIIVLHNGRTSALDTISWVEDRVYQLFISINAGVASLSLTTSEDPDFIVSKSLTGFSDMSNPTLHLEASTYRLFVDKFEIAPIMSKNTAIPSYDVIYEDAPANSITTSNNYLELDELYDKVSGYQSIKASTDEVFLSVNSLFLDSSNRYLSYAMKNSNDNTQSMISFIIDIDGVLTSKVLTGCAKTSLNDVVYVNDNKWHTYVYDIYDLFSGLGSINTIEEVSFQKIGGSVLFDRVYLLSDMSSAIALASSVSDTSERIDNSFSNKNILQTRYDFNRNIFDSSGNGYNYGTTIPFEDNFNDNEIDPVWTVTDSQASALEINQRMELNYTGGGSGYPNSIISKTVDGNFLKTLDLDFGYDFKTKMGNQYFYGLNSAGQKTWQMQWVDCWTGSSQRAYMYAYDANGGVTNSWSQTVSGQYAGSGHFNVMFNGPRDVTMNFTFPGASPHVMQVPNTGVTATVGMSHVVYASYYIAGELWWFDNFKESYLDPFTDNFNDNSIDPMWTITNSQASAAEVNQRMELNYNGGGSGNPYSTSSKSVDGNTLTSLDLDFSYDFKTGMGVQYFYGLNSAGQMAWSMQWVDCWGGSGTQRAYMYAYNANGEVTSTWSQTVSSQSDPATSMSCSIVQRM